MLAVAASGPGHPDGSPIAAGDGGGTMNDFAKQWRLKALTDLWTGDANRSGGRTIPAGLLGSIRVPELGPGRYAGA